MRLSNQISAWALGRASRPSSSRFWDGRGLPSPDQGPDHTTTPSKKVASPKKRKILKRSHKLDGQPQEKHGSYGGEPSMRCEDAIGESLPIPCRKREKAVPLGGRCHRNRGHQQLCSETGQLLAQDDPESP
jgi:hypothetical protein